MFSSQIFVLQYRFVGPNHSSIWYSFNHYENLEDCHKERDKMIADDNSANELYGNTCELKLEWKIGVYTFKEIESANV